jgi:hypothetical protein
MLQASLLFNFLVHEDTFWSICSSKNFREKSLPKIYLGQDTDPELDPDPDVFKSRIRIRSKIVRIRNTAKKTKKGLEQLCLGQQARPHDNPGRGHSGQKRCPHSCL